MRDHFENHIVSLLITITVGGNTLLIYNFLTSITVIDHDYAHTRIIVHPPVFKKCFGNLSC